MKLCCLVPGIISCFREGLGIYEARSRKVRWPIRAILQDYFHKYISPGIFLQIHFSRTISTNTFLQDYFYKYISPGLFPQIHFSRTISTNTFLQNYFYKYISAGTFLSSADTFHQKWFSFLQIQFYRIISANPFHISAIRLHRMIKFNYDRMRMRINYTQPAQDDALCIDVNVDVLV